MSDRHDSVLEVSGRGHRESPLSKAANTILQR
jgi:hypothetical protein